MKELLSLMLLLLAICTQTVTAEEAVVEKDTSEESETAPEAERQEQRTPDADNLRNRDLGEAFRNFRPSEEISADNAVSFPVDI